MFDNIKPLQGISQYLAGRTGAHVNQVCIESTKSQVFHALFPDLFHLPSPCPPTVGLKLFIA